MARRYFVTVLADSPRSLRELGELGLDLFQSTAKETADGKSAIEGLVTMEEVERLVDAGCQVLVEEESSKRARAVTDTVEFDEWLKDMEV